MADICQMQSMADRLINFYQTLTPPQNIPKGIDLLFPQKDPQVIEIVEKFFKKYFNDERPRGLLLGINPGRHGAGMTGVNFTAPKQLKDFCGIDHHLKPSSELSAEFIYEMIDSYGGVKRFYQDWFIGSACPLGFVTSTGSSSHPLERRKPTPGNIKRMARTPSPSGGGDAAVLDRENDGKNINYYDDKRLFEAVSPFIIECMNKLVKHGFRTEKCICIGGEKNFKFLSALNHEYKWFGEIIPLPHPRFILQYRRKQKDQFIHQYLSALNLAG